MLTTTIGFSRRASSIRLRCPAWSAPIVGTSPIARPSLRQCRDASSIEPGSSNTAKGLSGAVPDLFFFCAGRRCRAVCRVSVLGARELATGDLSGKTLGGAADLLGEIGVALDELRRLAGRQAEHVVKHQDLAVGTGTGPDADGWDPNGLRDAARELAWHSLEDQAERSSLLELFGVGQDPRRLSLALALDLEAAHLVDELRRQTKVTHDRDAQLGQAAGDLNDATAALQLDGVHATFLKEPAGAGDRLLDGDVIRHERHIAHEQSLSRTPGDRLGMVDHFV